MCSFIFAQESIEESTAEELPSLLEIATDTEAVVLPVSESLSAAVAMEFPVHSETAAFVFSLSDSVRHVEDEIILVNHSFNRNMNFKVEVYNPKKKDWVKYGTASIKNVNDICCVKSRHSGSLGKFTHAAVIPETKGVNFKAFRHNDDFLVYVEQPENTIPMDNVVTIERDGGKFKDNIRFLNNSLSLKDASFAVFGISGDLRLFLGTAYLTSFGDTCFVKSYHDVTAFQQYQVVSENNIPFFVETFCKRNDMYVAIMTEDVEDSEPVGNFESVE